MMKALSKITGQAKALKFAMDLAKNHGIFLAKRQGQGCHSSIPMLGGSSNAKAW